MNHIKENYKKLIWKYVWVGGDKRWLFHAHGTGVRLEGKVQIGDGSIFDWDVDEDQLTIGTRVYIIISLQTNGNGALVIRDDKDHEETFVSL